MPMLSVRERNGSWKHGGDTNEAVELRRAASPVDAGYP